MNEITLISNEAIFIVEKEKLSFSLSEQTLIKLLGYSPASAPQPVIEAVGNLLPKVTKLLSPQGGFKLFDFGSVSFGKDSFNVKEQTFECGKIIASNFKKCESLAILTVSLGNKISDEIRILMDSGDILSGFILDKIASEIVEQFADKIEEMISSLCQKQNLKITNRYSPGYCGWDVKEQQKLFSLLPDNFCGISLTDSSLMLPIKSVSAVIGIGKYADKREYQCSICDIEFCYKRERNE